jgi:hypothetical protein
MVTLDAGPDADNGAVGCVIGAPIVLSLTHGWFDEGRLERAYTYVKSYPISSRYMGQCKGNKKIRYRMDALDVKILAPFREILVRVLELG